MFQNKVVLKEGCPCSGGHLYGNIKGNVTDKTNKGKCFRKDQ